MAEHTGPGHGDVTLSLTEMRDGHHVHQSWGICECSARTLRVRLGPPQQETVASLDASLAIGEAVRNQPGAVHRLSSDEEQT